MIFSSRRWRSTVTLPNSDFLFSFVCYAFPCTPTAAHPTGDTHNRLSTGQVLPFIALFVDLHTAALRARCWRCAFPVSSHYADCRTLTAVIPPYHLPRPTCYDRCHNYLYPRFYCPLALRLCVTYNSGDLPFILFRFLHCRCHTVHLPSYGWDDDVVVLLFVVLGDPVSVLPPLLHYLPHTRLLCRCIRLPLRFFGWFCWFRPCSVMPPYLPCRIWLYYTQRLLHYACHLPKLLIL